MKQPVKQLCMFTGGALIHNHEMKIKEQFFVLYKRKTDKQNKTNNDDI